MKIKSILSNTVAGLCLAILSSLAFAHTSTVTLYNHGDSTMNIKWASCNAKHTICNAEPDIKLGFTGNENYKQVILPYPMQISVISAQNYNETYGSYYGNPERSRCSSSLGALTFTQEKPNSIVCEKGHKADISE